MTTLRGLTWAHPRGHDALLPATRAWAAANAGVEVTWDARSLHAFGDDSFRDHAADYDLVVIDHPHIPEAHEEGWLLALDGRGRDDDLEALADDFVGRTHESYQAGGHQYGLAIDAATQVAVARPDLLPDMPSDWDAVLELARAGRVLWPLTPVNVMASFLTFLGQRGSALEHGYEAAAAEDSLERMRELASLVPPFCLGETPIDTAERLAAGDEWWYAPLAYGYTNYSRDGFRATRLVYRDIPAYDDGVAGACLGGAGIAVSAETAHPDLAVDLALTLASPEVQRGSYFEAGGQPGHVAAWDDDDCNEATLDFFRGTRRTTETSSMRPRSTGWMAAQIPLGQTIHRYLAGEGTTSETLARVTDLLEPVTEAAS